MDAQGSKLQSRTELIAPSTDALLQRLHSSVAGLTAEEARERLGRFGANRLKGKSRAAKLTLLLGQFKSPIVLILIAADILILK